MRADAQAIVWLSLYSDRATELELTDYAERHIKDRLAATPGVAAVWIWGARHYAMRIWLDVDRLTSRGLTVQDVEAARTALAAELPERERRRLGAVMVDGTIDVGFEEDAFAVEAVAEV